MADERREMLIVTENAKRYLKRLLVANTSDLNLGIRLELSKGMQLGVLLDHRADDDYVVEHEGAKVLMVGHDLFTLVDGAILDAESNGTVESLIITKGGQQLSKKARDNLCLEGGDT
jgi:Fe-S cluster assembly iron-binding protein IscA